MTTIKLTGALIASDDDAGTLRYRLLTYGEPGRTNVGVITAARGVITLPEDVNTLEAVNIEHDRTRPAGRFATLEDTDEALYATVRTLDTTAGRDVRLEAREGVRAGISVEIENIVIRAGKLLAGTLTGAGFVVRPAFPSSLLVAADAGDLTPDDEDEDQEQDDEDEDDEQPADGETVAEHHEQRTDSYTDPATGETITTETTVESTTTIEDHEETTTMGQTTIKGAAAGTTGAVPHQPTGFGLATLTAALGDMEHLRGVGKLTAALEPITQTDPFDTITVPEYVGELWEGRSPVERYAGLVRDAGTLTNYVSKGWRFAQGPEVHPYEGNLADITSTPIEVETEEIRAFRLAGGNRIDRVYTDLPDAGFWDSYLRHSTQDYALKRDALIGYHLATNAIEETYTGSTPSFYNGSSGWAYLVRAARIAMRKIVPDFAVVGADLWEEMALTPREYALEYLSAQLGLDDTGSLAGFRIIGASDEPIENIDGETFDMTGKVLVGTTGTTLKQELAGGPIRVNAEVIEKGGVDHGVFGYCKIWTPTPYNVLVTPDTAGV